MWWDRQIPYGQDFTQTIQRELEGASCVVVIWSPDSVKSTFVRDEASEALRNSRLVPVRFSDVQPPLGFRQLQVADLSGWRQRTDAPEFVLLISSIRALADRTASQRPRSTEGPVPWMGGVAAWRRAVLVSVIVLSLVIGYWAFHNSSEEPHDVARRGAVGQQATPKAVLWDGGLFEGFDGGFASAQGGRFVYQPHFGMSAPLSPKVVQGTYGFQVRLKDVVEDKQYPAWEIRGKFVGTPQATDQPCGGLPDVPGRPIVMAGKPCWRLSLTPETPTRRDAFVERFLTGERLPSVEPITYMVTAEQQAGGGLLLTLGATTNGVFGPIDPSLAVRHRWKLSK